MNKTQYTKVITTITTILFIMTLTISLGFIIYITLTNTGELVDYVVFTTAVTVVGGIYAMCIKFYMSKSGLENVAKIRSSVYKEIMNTRLEYDEKVIRLKKYYGVEQSDIEEIEDNAPFKNLSDMVVSQTTNKLDEVDSIHESEPNTDY